MVVSSCVTASAIAPCLSPYHHSLRSIGVASSHPITACSPLPSALRTAGPPSDDRGEARRWTSAIGRRCGARQVGCPPPTDPVRLVGPVPVLGRWPPRPRRG